MEMTKLSHEEADVIINRLNSLIADGTVDVSMNDPESLVVMVFGIRKAEYKDMTWREITGKFLGSGVSECYGYELKTNDQRIVINEYARSLKMFLNYVEKHLTNFP